jgi:hypothetical protein
MFLVEGRLTGALAALATAGVLAFCSTRDDRPAVDASPNGRPIAAVSQATSDDPIQPRAAQHSLLASRDIGGSVRTPRY